MNIEYWIIGAVVSFIAIGFLAAIIGVMEGAADLIKQKRKRDELRPASRGLAPKEEDHD